MDAQQPISQSAVATKQTPWAVLRYGTGANGTAVFGGWFSERERALARVQRWRVKYPYLKIALVKFDHQWNEQ
jgi:hypothetical protein